MRTSAALRTGMLAVLLALAPVQVANCATMAGNLGSGLTNFYRVGTLVSRSNWIAVPFTPTSTARLGQVLLPLEEFQGCRSCSVIDLRIETDSSGLPSGASIESFTAKNLRGMPSESPVLLVVLNGDFRYGISRKAQYRAIGRSLIHEYRSAALKVSIRSTWITSPQASR